MARHLIKTHVVTTARALKIPTIRIRIIANVTQDTAAHFARISFAMEKKPMWIQCQKFATGEEHVLHRTHAWIATMAGLETIVKFVNALVSILMIQMCALPVVIALLQIHAIATTGGVRRNAKSRHVVYMTTIKMGYAMDMVRVIHQVL